MITWIAALLLCETPEVSSCKMMAHRQPFYNVTQCQSLVDAAQQSAHRVGLIAIGACYRIEVENV